MPRQLHILHFNDVYNIEPGSQEPVGGAARFVAKVKALVQACPAPPLVLFSGDALNPSLMSTFTQGHQMLPVLNACGTHAACLGNHDLDWGIPNFQQFAAGCSFPWLLANVLDAGSGEPIAGVARSVMLTHASGARVGVVGLAEGDWVETLSCVEPEEVAFLDFITEGRRLARQLRAEGAELVVALTHSRAPNDIALAQQVPEFDMVLGGHDHHYQAELVAPHGVLLVKSGTDFRDLSLITADLPDAAASADGGERATGAAADGACNGSSSGGSSSGGSSDSSSSRVRPVMSWQRHTITGDLPEDPEIAAVVAEFAEQMGARMDEPIARTLTELDGRFATVRRRESNLASLVCDVFRRACSADVALMNSGTFRSDALHPPGHLTYRDLMSILPMMDDTVVLEVSGQQLLAALENGVSQWPKLEGRFPQVSGVRFTFDPARPPGSRVLADSVVVGSARAPLEPGGAYTLATKAYLAEGKDGYDVLAGCRVLVDAECCPLLPTCLRAYFNMLQALNLLDPSVDPLRARCASFAKRWQQRVKRAGWSQERDLVATGSCVRDPASSEYAVAPVADGRIRNVAAGGGSEEAVAELGEG